MLVPNCCNWVRLLFSYTGEIFEHICALKLVVLEMMQNAKQHFRNLKEKNHDEVMSKDS